jgi:hypothetical protein
VGESPLQYLHFGVGFTSNDLLKLKWFTDQDLVRSDFVELNQELGNEFLNETNWVRTTYSIPFRCSRPHIFVICV